MNSNRLTAYQLSMLGHNFVTALAAKHITTVDGLSHQAWLTLWESRVGQEPIFRLCFALTRSMDAAGVMLAEVLCEDPALMVQCLRDGDIAPYHQQYPPGGSQSPASQPQSGVQQL